MPQLFLRSTENELQRTFDLESNRTRKVKALRKKYLGSTIAKTVRLTRS